MGAAIRTSYSVICCRILLNLRGATTPNDHSTTVSKGLVFASSHGEPPNQADTIQLEACNTRDDEENHGGGMAEASSWDVNHPGVEAW